MLTGARIGELVIMRPVDIDTTGRVWSYCPAEHKTAHYGHNRRIYIGPRAQQAIRPFLTRPVDAYLFDPREAVAERADVAHTHRRPGQKPNPCKTRRVVRRHYDVSGVRRAIRRACDKADIPR